MRTIQAFHDMTNASIGAEAPGRDGALYSSAVINSWNFHDGRTACVTNYFVTYGAALCYAKSVVGSHLGQYITPVAILKIKTRKICQSN